MCVFKLLLLSTQFAAIRSKGVKCSCVCWVNAQKQSLDHMSLFACCTDAITLCSCRSCYCARACCCFQPLYSRQGENPTAARNTHKASDEDLQVQGNALVKKTTALATTAATRRNDVTTATAGSNAPAAIDLYSNSQRSIQITQNDMASEPLVRPKRDNTEQLPPPPPPAAAAAKSFLQKIGLASLFNNNNGNSNKAPVNKLQNVDCKVAAGNRVASYQPAQTAMANQIGADCPGDKCNIVTAASLGFAQPTEVCVHGAVGAPMAVRTLTSATHQPADGASTHRLVDLSINAPRHAAGAVMTSHSSADLSPSSDDFSASSDVTALQRPIKAKRPSSLPVTGCSAAIGGGVIGARTKSSQYKRTK